LDWSSLLRQRPLLRGGVAIGLVAALMVLLSLATDVHALRYEREAILQGEWWRLLTGHLVHFDLHHLLLNLAGLALIAALFPSEYSMGSWLLIVLTSVLAIDVGFFYLRPSLVWYVGASGALHGALAAGAIKWWREQPRWLAGALTAILLGKLAWEQTHGGLPLSGSMPVVVDAHLFGTAGGACAALALWAGQRLGIVDSRTT
jgi:rhomboid family GlyGly-CTERM serine protease